MISQKLIIYNFPRLYQIFEELNLELGFKVSSENTEDSLANKIKDLKNYLIISNKRFPHIDNQIVLENMPINFYKLVEKINIELLKLQFNQQSEVKIQNYYIDLNSREIKRKGIKLKLTEKEIDTIIYLSKLNKPAKIDELQKKVWSYQSNMETHTVETHIYRLRQKFFNTFDDKNFIISKKNGYEII